MCPRCILPGRRLAWGITSFRTNVTVGVEYLKGHTECTSSLSEVHTYILAVSTG